MSSQTLSLSPELTQYLRNYGVREPEILKSLREETINTFEAAPMQISPEQGQFFRFLLETMHAQQILEIGTFTGYSSICFALAIPEHGHVTCCDLSDDWTRLAVKYWEKAKLQNKMTLHLAPALKTLETLVQNKKNYFDFAFIDADKPNYIDYYEYCFALVRPGGVIAIDNVLWGGEVMNLENQDINTNTIRALNQKISQDKRVLPCMLPVGDGLTLVRKAGSVSGSAGI